MDSATTPTDRFARMRSVLEVPIMTERFWSKVPDVPADAIMIDLEDSVLPSVKDAARAAAVHWLGRPEYFGGRPVFVRVNNLDSPWGRDDVAALRECPADVVVCYPKVRTADEIAELQSALGPTAAGARGLYVMIETAAAVLDVAAIARCEGVVGLHFGYVDLAADVGSRAFDGDGLYEPAAAVPRSLIAAAAASNGLFSTGGTLIPDYRDLAKVETFVRMWRDSGYTACVAVSPSHLDVVNSVMGPSDAEVEQARAVCDAYAQAVEAGEPAAVLDGRVITLPDQRVARRVLERAGAV